MNHILIQKILTILASFGKTVPFLYSPILLIRKKLIIIYKRSG